MDCHKCKKLIAERFIGSLSREQEELIASHIEKCSECQKFLMDEEALNDGIRELDARSFRADSIESFSRLAFMVRSYRTPKPFINTLYQIKGMKTVSVAAVILILVIGLSNINYSYSYTNGASMQISFDPPLKKLESLDLDEFNERINSAIYNAISDEGNRTRISWAVAIDKDALKSISVDVQTDETSDLVSVFDSLLSNYPSLSLGKISVSPLKEQVSESVFAYLVSRKKNSIEDDEIKRVVSTDFHKITKSADVQYDIIDSNVERLQRAIEKEIPQIRELVRRLTADLKYKGGSALDINALDSAAILGGAQVTKPFSRLIPEEYLKQEIKRICERNGLVLDKNDFNRLVHVEYDAPITRIMIGDTGDLFSTRAIGGWGLTIIQGVCNELRLNGLAEIVSKEEIDSVLNGRISPTILERSILERQTKLNFNNEKVVIEVLKDKDTRAEIIFGSGMSKVNLISTSEKYQDSTISQSDNNKQWLDGNVSSEIVETKSQSFDEFRRQAERKISPPSFSRQYGILPSYILEDDIENLIEGKISSDELEKMIEKRLEEEKINPGFQNIFLVKNGKAVTIKLMEKRAKIEVEEWKGAKSEGNSVVVRFKE